MSEQDPYDWPEGDDSGLGCLLAIAACVIFWVVVSQYIINHL